MRKFKVRLWQEYNWWVAHCPQTGITTQAGSESEAMDNIAEALDLFFEAPSAAPDATPLPALLQTEPLGAQEREVSLAD